MKLSKSLILLTGVVTLISFTGCADTETYDSVDASGKPVSSTPWSKPESWEQGGQLGNALGAAGSPGGAGAGH
jgi:hypothetical protein